MVQKDGEALPLLLFNYIFEYAIRMVQENQVRVKVNGTYHIIGADDENLLGDNLRIITN
jgi:hypothetical protein